jgi:hypothetical protein
LQIKVSTCICKFLFHASIYIPCIYFRRTHSLEFTQPRYWKLCNEFFFSVFTRVFCFKIV